VSESNGDGMAIGFVLLCIIGMASIAGLTIITYGQDQPVKSKPFSPYAHIGIEDLELGKSYNVTGWQIRGPDEEHEYYIWLKDSNNTRYILGLDELPQNCSSIQDLVPGTDKIIKTETGIAKAT